MIRLLAYWSTVVKSWEDFIDCCVGMGCGQSAPLLCRISHFVYMWCLSLFNDKPRTSAKECFRLNSCCRFLTVNFLKSQYYVHLTFKILMHHFILHWANHRDFWIYWFYRFAIVLLNFTWLINNSAFMYSENWFGHTICTYMQESTIIKLFWNYICWWCEVHCKEWELLSYFLLLPVTSIWLKLFSPILFL